MSEANNRQVDGDHYRKTPDYQHWDWAWDLGLDNMQYTITKYMVRYPKKHQSVVDLEKSSHFLEKYIELVRLCSIGMGTRQRIMTNGKFSNVEQVSIKWMEDNAVHIELRPIILKLVQAGYAYDDEIIKILQEASAMLYKVIESERSQWDHAKSISNQGV